MDGRERFTTATAGFCRVLDGIGEHQLNDPELGEWDVRSLIGHTCRAFITIETDLVAAADNAVAATPLGGIRPIDYLPTRAFELTVHGIDLAWQPVSRSARHGPRGLNSAGFSA